MKLLKTVSLIMIVVSIIGLVIYLMTLLGSGAYMAAGAGSAPLLFILSASAILSCVFELITGIVGLRAANGTGSKKTCKILAIVVLVLSGLSLITSIIGGSFQWSSIFGLALPILYFVGINQMT